MNFIEAADHETGLPASIELSAPSGQVLRVAPQSRRTAFLCEFARQCFFTGRFPAEGRRTNSWILDCRHGLAHGVEAQRCAKELVHLAGPAEMLQFAGMGFGACFLLGAILGVEQQTRIGLIRPTRKTVGRRQLIEGRLDRDRPVCVVDDVINSGRTVSRAVRLLRQNGFTVHRALCLFQYSWGGGAERLSRLGVECSCLATMSQSGRVSPPRIPLLWRGLIARFWRG